MSILAVINHRLTRACLGVAALAAVVALGWPTPQSNGRDSYQPAESAASPVTAPAVELPRLDFSVSPATATQPTHTASLIPAEETAPVISSSGAPVTIIPVQAAAPIASPNPPPIDETSAPTPLSVQAAAPVMPVPAGLPASEANLQLRQLNADQFHARLELAFDRALPRMPDDGTPWLRFAVDIGDNLPVLIAANRQTGEVRIVGRP